MADAGEPPPWDDSASLPLPRAAHGTSAHGLNTSDERRREEEDRARRQRALRELAWAQLGLGVPPPEVFSPAQQRPRRRPVLAGLLLLALVAGGTLLALHVTSERSHRAQITPTASVTEVTLLGGGPCVTLVRHPQPPYANIQVTHDAYPAHSEPEIAENPANPLELVGGSKYFTDSAHYVFQIGYAYSRDGGCTWTDGGTLAGFPRSELVSDVTFAFGPADRAYAAVLFSGLSTPECGIAVFMSRDAGRTFGKPTLVFEEACTSVFSDKPWISVDNTHGPTRGNVYVAWSYDYDASCPYSNFCFEELAFSRSTDGGKTFSPVRRVEGSAPYCTNPVPHRPAGSTRCDAALGATPVIEPDGTLAIAYAYQDILYGTHNHQSIPTRMLVITSHDGGQTWSPSPVLAATIHDVPFQLLPDRFRNFALPAFAADPAAAGHLYLVWADERQHHAEIVLSASRDSGQTWSAPVLVNDNPLGDGANHAQPALAVAPDGVVSVTFFDTRNDPAHRLLDVYLAQSVDGGATFLPNVRVTSQSIDPSLHTPLDGSGTPFFGDYQGLTADNLFVHPLWNDTRTGIQQLETAALPSAQT
jgi:BNR/Asp-box repeat